MQLFKRDYLRFFKNQKLGVKIQFSFTLLLLPISIAFVFIFFTMYSYNKQYDVIMTNATKAGAFNIDFKENFDQKSYFLIVGRMTFEETGLDKDIDGAVNIVTELIDNTNLASNQWRAQAILNMLENLSKYIGLIIDNQKESGHYDENKALWENDIQSVTRLITQYVLEYTYYENLRLEELRDEINKNLNAMTLLGIVFFIVMIPVAGYVSWRISRSIAKPIDHISDVTKQVAHGDLSVRVGTLLGAEVSALGESLNTMIERIEQLVSKVKSDETMLREAELALLQAQINPHFLYNTLDTIIWLAEGGQKQRLIDVVGALSDFFRTSLSRGSDMVTLREEERHVCSYMQIQQVRYQDILKYKIDISEEFYEAKIPKITLQPLVENALYHGTKNKRGMGEIVIKAKSDGNDAVLSVIDNGLGMTNERFQRVCSLLDGNLTEENEGSRDYYGLYNVNERLKLKFGPEYGLTISNTYGEGVTVFVRIPLNHKIIN